MADSKRSLCAFFRSPREIALTLGAIVGLVCLGFAAASLVFGVKPLVFRSGSMSPIIQTGALAFARDVPASGLDVGDVVSVENQSGTRITHRIVEVDAAGDGRAALTLRGDANNVNDRASYVVDSADRVFFHVNKAGYAVAWLSSPIMRVVGVVAALALLVMVFRPSRSQSTENSPETGIDGELVSESASAGSNFADVTKLEVEK